MHLLKGSLISLNIEEKSYPIIDSQGKRLKDEKTKEFLSVLTEGLANKGYKTIDCTQWKENFSFIGDYLSYLVKGINESKSNLHLSIVSEPNKKYIDFWVGSYGKSYKFAERISKELIAKGINYSSVKIGENYLIDHSEKPVIIIKGNFENFNSEKIELITKAIIEAII
ncbi:MAG: hypothetical protein ACRDD2_02505 [Sarcina sp.]